MVSVPVASHIPPRQKGNEISIRAVRVTCPGTSHLHYQHCSPVHHHHFTYSNCLSQTMACHRAFYSSTHCGTSPRNGIMTNNPAAASERMIILRLAMYNLPVLE